jgi:hypothetical protein
MKGRRYVVSRICKGCGAREQRCAAAALAGSAPLLPENASRVAFFRERSLSRCSRDHPREDNGATGQGDR